MFTLNIFLTQTQKKTMRTIKERNGYHLVKIIAPVYGGFYAVMKNGIYIEDGLCLDSAIEIFNNLTQTQL